MSCSLMWVWHNNNLSCLFKICTETAVIVVRGQIFPFSIWKWRHSRFQTVRACVGTAACEPQGSPLKKLCESKLCLHNGLVNTGFLKRAICKALSLLYTLLVTGNNYLVLATRVQRKQAFEVYNMNPADLSLNINLNTSVAHFWFNTIRQKEGTIHCVSQRNEEAALFFGPPHESAS